MLDDDFNFVDSPPDPPSNGLAIASIVLGVGSLLLIWVKLILIFLAPIFIIATIIGIFLAVAARKRNAIAGHPTILGTIGLILNVLALIVHSVAFIACNALVACACNILG